MKSTSTSISACCKFRFGVGGRNGAAAAATSVTFLAGRCRSLALGGAMMMTAAVAEMAGEDDPTTGGTGRETRGKHGNLPLVNYRPGSRHVEIDQGG